MCWPIYEKSLLYKCPCTLDNNFTAPRILRNYTIEELDLLLQPSQKIGYHYYKKFFGGYYVEKQYYCNTCLLNNENKSVY
jgi:hypothetical protein